MKLSHIFLIFSLISINIYAQNKNKPNILWIVTDDQRADSVEAVNTATLDKPESKLGYVSSPNINKLAKEGVLFVNAYCNSPACAPSRSSMITGQYPHHSGRYGFEQTHNQTSLSKPSIPEVLKKQGYHTSIFGKSGYYIFKWEDHLTWKNAGFYDLDISMKKDLYELGFTDYSHITTYLKQGGTNKIENFHYGNGKKISYYTKIHDSKPSLTDLKTKKKIDQEFDILRAYPRKNQMIIGGVSPSSEEKTLDAYILKEFQNFLIHKNKSFQTLSGRSVKGANTSKPLFLNLSFHFPHTPILPPSKFREQFKNKTYTVPEFNKNIELKTLPPQLKKLYEKMKIDELKPHEKQQAIRDYYAFCSFGDSLIGSAIHSFKKYNEENNQEYIIILTVGDHGWQLGEQGIEAKFAPYRTSNQGAAIIVSSDKSVFVPNTVNRDFIEYVDFAPTIFKAAQIDITSNDFKYLDGKDLSLVANQKIEKREYVIGEMNHVIGPRAYLRSKDFAFSMRIKAFNSKPNDKNPPGKDIKWAIQSPLQDLEVALFDLRKDPEEKINVALNPKYLKLSEWFRKKLGNIVLGDSRLEVNWAKKDSYFISDFAKGSDDKKLTIPKDILK